MRRTEDEVATRAGLDESEASEAISTVNEAIAPYSRVRAEELFFRLASRLGIAYGRAIEVAQVACHSIAASLDEDERRQLLNRLPGDVRELFRAPASLAEPRAREPGMPGTGHTLADGRPGSEHSLTGSRPGSSHPLGESHLPARHPR